MSGLYANWGLSLFAVFLLKAMFPHYRGYCTKWGGNGFFSEIGYDFSQHLEYKCSTWGIKNSTGAKNSPWIMSFYFRQWGCSLAVSAIWTGPFCSCSPPRPCSFGLLTPMAVPSQGQGYPAPAPSPARPLLAPALHQSPLGNPRGLFLGGFQEKKRPRIIVSSPEVFSPHKGVMAPLPSLGAGSGRRAHAEELGVRLDLGSLFPSAPHVHRSGGLLLPQKCPTKELAPSCLLWGEETRSPGRGGSPVGREVVWGDGLPFSRMAPCEPLCEGQQDLAGDKDVPSLGWKEGWVVGDASGRAGTIRPAVRRGEERPWLWWLPCGEAGGVRRRPSLLQDGTLWAPLRGTAGPGWWLDVPTLSWQERWVVGDASGHAAREEGSVRG